MKKLTVAIICSLGLVGAANAASFHGCPDKDTIFAAPTVKGTKAVELCKVSNGFRYTFGPAGKPELSVVQPADKVTFYGGMAGGFEFVNGNIEYSVALGKFSGADLVVTNLKTHKTLATIAVDDISDNYVNETYQYR